MQSPDDQAPWRDHRLERLHSLSNELHRIRHHVGDMLLAARVHAHGGAIDPALLRTYDDLSAVVEETDALLDNVLRQRSTRPG